MRANKKRRLVGTINPNPFVLSTVIDKVCIQKVCSRLSFRHSDSLHSLFSSSVLSLALHSAELEVQIGCIASRRPSVQACFMSSAYYPDRPFLGLSSFFRTEKDDYVQKSNLACKLTKCSGESDR